MGDGLRTVRVLTTDESLLTSTRCAVEPIEGWEVSQVATVDDLLDAPPVAGDLLLIDAWARGENVYELCRRLAGKTKCRTYLVVGLENDLAEPIARFCGATGVMTRPVTKSRLESAVSGGPQPPTILPSEHRGEGTFDLPETLLVDIQSGEPNTGLIQALIDPATGLFNYAFLNYKLDEEFKRASRFSHPLACVMLGFEGQAEEEVLRQLASIFLATSRDTDILGRFDENSFLFLLPNTGPDGAAIMVERVAEMAGEQGLKDLVGDALTISVGISLYPTPGIEQREELYSLAREAFLAARSGGGGVVLGQ